MLQLNMTLDKSEITKILHSYAENLFTKNTQITIDLVTKPKAGVTATITIYADNLENTSPEVTPTFKAIKPVSDPEPEEKAVKEPITVKESKTTLDSLIDDGSSTESAEDNSMMTNASIFNKMSS